MERMEKSKKTMLIIDGEYFEESLKLIKKPLPRQEIEIQKLFKFLEEKTGTDRFSYQSWNTASNDKTLKYIVSMCKCHFNTYQVKTKTVGCRKCREKNRLEFPAKLDIKMSVDIMKRVLDHGYQKLVLMAQDVDFEPLCRHLIGLNVEIYIVGFNISTNGPLRVYGKYVELNDFYSQQQ